MNVQHAFPGSAPKISCSCARSNSHNSRTLPTLLMTCLTFFAVIPGKDCRSSSAAALTPAPASGSSSAPTMIAFVGSGSGLLALRSRKISAVAYGDEDQIIRRRGKVSVSRTSLDWMLVEALKLESDAETDFFDAYLSTFAYDLTSATAYVQRVSLHKVLHRQA